MSSGNFYITTTIPYVNADPHLGFALEIVQADVIARYQRFLGREVFFSTGTDEYGQKIWQSAERDGKNAQTYVDEYTVKFAYLKEKLNLSYTNFIRTTDPKHIEAAQEFWRLCDEKGDIYKKAYRGLYCVGCEKFLKEKDLVDGACPFHPNQKPEVVEEENYFFRFSRYTKELLEYLASSEVIYPDWRRKEAIEFVRQGLEDFSISRSIERLSWGIPVPGDASQIMYVWFGAFVNYLSTLGWPRTKELFEKFWQGGETVQVAGKDMVRFQSLMWQAMLMSADFKTTNRIVYHGFITNSGQKMSKSLGNVIDPFVIIDEYGTDALRYYLLRELTSFEDGDFTMGKFREAHNANLANGLGNLVSRVMKMAENYKVRGERDEGKMEMPKEIQKSLDRYDFKSAMDYVWDKIASLDKRIQETEPFKLYKIEPEKAKEIVTELVKGVYEVGEILAPFMPETSEKIITAVKTHIKPKSLFVRK